MLALDALQAATAADFAAALDGVFEHAPWVAERAATRRPFATVAALHDALMDEVERAPPEQLDSFLRAHPELAASKLPAGLTTESTAEQTGLAMDSAAEAVDLPALNRAYRERFGIPFIVCVARHTPENVIRTLRRRLEHGGADERAVALAEVRHITRLRLVARVTGPGLPRTAGHLSTHVLDTARGRPAAGLSVTLLQEGRAIASVATDDDGRTPPVVPDGPLRQGRYTLAFAAGDYQRRQGAQGFYETIPVAFTIDDAEGHYHVPLLLAPFSYSTYRGS